MLEPAVLRDRARYERRIDGWVDNLHDDALTHTVRIVDPERALELTAVVTPPPAYLIRAVRCRALDRDFDVAHGLDTLVGTPMTAGLTRRAAAAAGAGDSAALVVDAVIEAARLARQVTKLPPARAARAESGDAREYWQLDAEGWSDLPDSCFTYSAAGRRLFDTRTVVAAATPVLYSPPPGQRKVFERRKLMRLERCGGRLVLFHSMRDNVHGFEVTYEIDAASARIITAEHTTPRLPYMGVCSEPQRRIAALVGETADAGLRRRIGEHLGGPAGCAQLYDLTADLLKLLA
ncbi:MAG TPA: DUF2889 domain-containing protein [Methylomirabilota bacterium]|nr:DUF2889 domain-containing protein [Methylomirabilota bacterium]